MELKKFTRKIPHSYYFYYICSLIHFEMKKITAILSFLLLSLGAMAQLEVKPDSFKEVAGFVNINLDIQSDDNDVPYAVIKVKTENINDKQRRELLFEGDAATFIECEYKIGEVWVYLTYKATYLKISHRDLSSTEFWFPFDMEPKKGYELTLTNNAKLSEEEILERMKKLEEAIQNQQEPQIVYVEEPVTPTPQKPTHKTPLNTFITLNLSNNTESEAAFGVTVGIKRKVGVFISFMSNFNFTDLGEEDKWDHINSTSMQALLDNNPTYASKRQYVSMSVIGGVVFKVAGPIDIKIGGGYGNNSLWMNIYDSYNSRTDFWISDHSSYGFGGLAGIQAHLGRFVVALDGATTNFKIFEGRMGIGYMFGKK